MAENGVIILAHGSRGELGAQAVIDALDRIASGMKVLLSPDVEIVGGAMQFNHPDLSEAAEHLIAKGARTIVVAPYFLFPGRHVMEDIPDEIKKLSSAHPGVRFFLADNLGLDESFVDLMARRITQVCPELALKLPASSLRPEEIEPLSMDIIDRLLPPLPGLSDGERTVVKRIVHTCGDLQIARLVRFSPSAISSAVAAIDSGTPIFTDVRMVASGISRTFLDICGCSVACTLDMAGTERAPTVTRTAQAIYDLGEKIDNAIIAIGNAPTALFALLDMIDNRGAKPALVVGMPVGFVRAAESKAELVLRNVPYITIEGTRGGSTLAAATVNALILIARDRRKATAKAVR